MTEAHIPQQVPERTDPRPVWLVEHPIHRYVQDVKAIARQAGLQIVDVAVASDDDLAHATDEPPELTLIADSEESGADASGTQQAAAARKLGPRTAPSAGAAE